MAVIKRKPTSPGRRFVVSVVTPDLHKGAPYAPLLAPKKKTGGRNSAGRITVRHIGGGHKQHYRIVDLWGRAKHLHGAWRVGPISTIAHQELVLGRQAKKVSGTPPSCRRAILSGASRLRGLNKKVSGKAMMVM